MNYTYKTKGTCSYAIDVEMDGNVLKKAVFHGGCNGNLQGISTLIQGMTYDEIAEKLSGIRCGFKDTSCPDQLVKAIRAAMKEANK